jgi:glycine/D-amino acid oxidase-like deaminating enzyme/nitrite reductase/ring-hydroxylating ferredoxin subunit
MEKRSGSSESVWKTGPGRDFEGQIREDTKADVCVIGAGIAGLTTAYLLTREGKRIVVLDDGPIGGGESGRTTAHLSNAIDDRYYEIQRLHGPDGARLAAESHSSAISRIEAIVNEEQIDCEFERLDGYLFTGPLDSVDVLDRELSAAHSAGLVDVSRVERAPLPSFDSGPCLRFPRQGQFHPLKYLSAIAGAIERGGGRIFTFTQAQKIEGGYPAQIGTKQGPVVNAEAVVVATNTPVNNVVAIHTKQAAYRTYAIAAKVPTGSITKALYWDTGHPYHYVRLKSADSDRGHAYDLLIVGGEDHKTGQADDAFDRYARLEQWTRAQFPMAKEVEFRWSGQVIETVDGLAFIGPNPLDKENVYICTGDSGMGMTHSTIAGMLLTDLIMGRKNEWAELYAPSRMPVGAASRFAQENLNVVTQYTDWLTTGSVENVEAIAPGSGGIVRRGLTKLAVYRDENGAIHERSAVCPHLGCLVDWNSAERTWDCPCHGSRFDCYGRVINGPAMSDLMQVEQPQPEDKSFRKVAE